MACTVMAHIVMADTVMAYTVMAYAVIAFATAPSESVREDGDGRTRRSAAWRRPHSSAKPLR